LSQCIALMEKEVSLHLSVEQQSKKVKKYQHYSKFAVKHNMHMVNSHMHNYKLKYN